MYLSKRLEDSTLKRRRSSVSGESHQDPCFGAAMDGTESNKTLPGDIEGNFLVKTFPDQHHIPYSNGTFSNYILPVISVIGISVDPFFLFVPFVDDTKKCFGLDMRFGINTAAFRLLFDIFYILYTAQGKRRISLIGLLAIIPLPLVVILKVFQTMEDSKLLYTIQLMKLCVIFQFVPRFIAIYELVADKFSRATFARAALSLFLFLLAGHVFGSFWYFFAVEREIECWKEACLNHTGCVHGSFYCGDNLGDYRFVNGFCPTKTRDTTIYDFGIFYDALQSGVVEATDFPQKFLHCFLWGLKTLSSFGSNLQLSGNGWESFFATLMIISALVLFLLFIGNIQAYMQSKDVSSETLRSLEVQDIEEWIPFQRLSKDLRNQVMRYQQYIYEKPNYISMENLLNNLPKEITRNIKRELCLELLAKIFDGADMQFLYQICDRLKMLMYSAESYLVQEYEQVEKMFFFMPTFKHFVVSSKGGRTSSSKFNNNTHDFYGEELIDWALNYQLHLPTSTITVRASKDVVVFALKAKDLKNVIDQALEHPSIKLPRIFRHYSSQLLVNKRKIMRRFRVITHAIVFTVSLREGQDWHVK